MVLVFHAHFVSVEILRNYLCQMNVEHVLTFIIVKVNMVIHSVCPLLAHCNERCSQLLTTDKRYSCACLRLIRMAVKVMMFSATFNNMSFITWLSVLEEIGVLGEKPKLY